jgi:hypothetical protein
MIAAILVMLASLLGCSIAVEAHQINLTNARIVISPDRIVEVEIALKGSDADRVAGTRVFDDATGLVRPAALTAASAMIVAYVRGHTTVLGEAGVSCQPGAAGIASDGDGVVVRVRFTFASRPDRRTSRISAESYRRLPIAPDGKWWPSTRTRGSAEAKVGIADHSSMRC